MVGRRALGLLAAALLLLPSCGTAADSEIPDASSGSVVPSTATSSAAGPAPSTAPPSAAPPSANSASAAPSPDDSSSAPRPKGTVITSGPSDFGPMLFDADDQAIYIWELEPTQKAECYGDCAVAWPPVLTKGEPVAEGKVKQRLLGTTERRDGSSQVTYNDHPLYFYVNEGPGEVECHNVSTHGGLWWVIQPDGDRAP